MAFYLPTEEKFGAKDIGYNKPRQLYLVFLQKNMKPKAPYERNVYFFVRNLILAMMYRFQIEPKMDCKKTNNVKMTFNY